MFYRKSIPFSAQTSLPKTNISANKHYKPGTLRILLFKPLNYVSFS